MKKIIIALAVGTIVIGGTIYTQVSKTTPPLIKSTSVAQTNSQKNNITKTTLTENKTISTNIVSSKANNDETATNTKQNINTQSTNNYIQTKKNQANTESSLKISNNNTIDTKNNNTSNNLNHHLSDIMHTNSNNSVNNSIIQNNSHVTNKNIKSSQLEAVFNNNSSKSNLIFSALQKANKKNMSTASIVVNTNDYKLINGTKYYNVYEYLLNNKSKDWSSNGNYSKSIGALYMNKNGKILSNQYIQNFNELSVAQKKEQIMLVAKQFISYFNYNGPITVDMNKSVTFEGYTCYLVTFGDNSFYINPAGFVYISKNQKFY